MTTHVDHESPLIHSGDDGRGFFCLRLAANCALVFLTACAGPKVVKTGYNFSHVKRVALGSFDGQGASSVSQEFVKQLLNVGFMVTDKPETADVVLSGSVTDYRPTEKMLVFIGTGKFPAPNTQSVEVINPIVGSASPTSEVEALGLPKMQVVAVSASIGVSAKLVDAQSQELVWADSDSYEGLNMASTIHIVATHLAQSIRKKIPVAATQGEHS